MSIVHIIVVITQDMSSLEFLVVFAVDMQGITRWYPCVVITIVTDTCNVSLIELIIYIRWITRYFLVLPAVIVGVVISVGIAIHHKFFYLRLVIVAMKIIILQMCRRIQSTPLQTKVNRLVWCQYIVYLFIGFHLQCPPFFLCTRYYLDDGFHFCIVLYARITNKLNIKNVFGWQMANFLYVLHLAVIDVVYRSSTSKDRQRSIWWGNNTWHLQK